MLLLLSLPLKNVAAAPAASAPSSKILFLNIKTASHSVLSPNLSSRLCHHNTDFLDLLLFPGPFPSSFGPHAPPSSFGAPLQLLLVSFSSLLLLSVQPQFLASALPPLASALPPTFFSHTQSRAVVEAVEVEVEDKVEVEDEVVVVVLLASMCHSPFANLVGLCTSYATTRHSRSN